MSNQNGWSSRSLNAVCIDRSIGANREYIQKEIPHISSLLVEDLEDAVKDAEIIVVGTEDAEVERIQNLLRPEQVLIDLAGRLAANGRSRPEGICW